MLSNNYFFKIFDKLLNLIADPNQEVKDFAETLIVDLQDLV